MVKLAQIALSVVLSVVVGCTSLRMAQRSCALLVIVDGGRYLPSAEQLENLERRIKPLLAEQNLVLSRDRTNAAFLARVEFTPDATDPRIGDFVIRVIETNPLPVVSTDADLTGLHCQQQESLRRIEQEAYKADRKSR